MISQQIHAIIRREKHPLNAQVAMKSITIRTGMGFAWSPDNFNLRKTRQNAHQILMSFQAIRTGVIEECFELFHDHLTPSKIFNFFNIA